MWEERANEQVYIYLTFVVRDNIWWRLKRKQQNGETKLIHRHQRASPTSGTLQDTVLQLTRRDQHSHREARKPNKPGLQEAEGEEELRRGEKFERHGAGLPSTRA